VNQGWIRFLEFIDQETLAENELHLSVDNYAKHKHAKVKRWLEKPPRFHIHFTPTNASRLNAVERFFRGLTERQLHRTWQR